MSTFEQMRITEDGGHDIEAVFSGLSEGNMDARFGPPETIRQNRTRLYSALGLSATRVTQMLVTGGDKIIDTSKVIPEPSSKREVTVIGDGLITTDFRHGLALFAADCIPMVVHSRHRPVVSLVHVGRTGAELGIHTKTIDRLTADYGVAPEDMRVHFGPSIHADSYRYEYLDPDTDWSIWENYLSEREDGFHIDLQGFTRRGLLEQGLSESQITASPADTGNGSGYFSHRRSQLTGALNGRNGSVVVMHER